LEDTKMLLAPSFFVSVATTEGPCDILSAAGNPCVAAHSTTRALYAEYDGPLYNVTKPNGQSKLIGMLSAGGFADKESHDAFCSPAMDCVISNVMDQSPNGNHLGQRHKLINASRHSITVGPDKKKVYGMWFDPGFGYHVDKTTNIATGNDPESMYAVMSGKNFNGHCCFDYGPCNPTPYACSRQCPAAAAAAHIFPFLHTDCTVAPSPTHTQTPRSTS
jgi:hypothetical protein